MKSNYFYRTVGIIIFAIVNLICFTSTAYAQKKTSFTSEINKQSHMFRLPIAGSDKYIEITAVSKTDKIAFVNLPEGERLVRNFKYVISDGTLGFIGVIQDYKGVPFVSIMVAITPEYGEWEFMYQIFHDETGYDEGLFPFLKVEFYDALKKENGPLYSTFSPTDAYNALVKWAKEHVTHYRE